MLSYANLEQRMANTYLDMFPPFVPLAGVPVSIQSQQQFYLFMKQVYQAIFDRPQLLFSKINADDAYPNRFNRTPYGKPKLIEAMRKDLSAIDELNACLFALGQNSTLAGNTLVVADRFEIKEKHRAVLPHLGLNLEGNVLSCIQYDQLFPAWQWLSNRPDATVWSFSRAMFDPEHSYMQDIYAALFGSQEIFSRMIRYLQQHGYTRVDNRRDRFALDYYKQKGREEAPLGLPIYGDPHHYGLAFEYRSDAAVPQYMVLRILDMKNLLLKFQNMPENLQAFIVQTAKKCDNCKYCTQTDKSGQRQPLRVRVSYHGEYDICPLYQGCYFCFTTLDENLVENLEAFLDFMDQHLTGGSKN
jgi:hypothetical protein